MHLILVPGAEVFALVRPHVLTLAANLIIEPLASVHTSITPDVLALSVFKTHVINTFIDGAILPGFLAFAVL